MVTLSLEDVKKSRTKRRSLVAGPAIEDSKEWHAFAILGEKTLFASHLTMHCMCEHAYQFVIETDFAPDVRRAFEADRAKHPGVTYFLANARGRHVDPNEPLIEGLTIPFLAGGERSFVGDIYRGWPAQLGEHWPWESEEGRRSVVAANVEIYIRRIVHFRPFIANLAPPDTLVYLMFGAGEEAHMVNLQFRFPDFDHILSLKSAPGWLAKDHLRAGAIFDLPHEPREKPPGFPLRCDLPFDAGAKIKLRHRGRGDERLVEIGRTAFFSTQVSNLGGPVNFCPCGP